MTSEEQILGVLEVIKHEAELNTAGTYFLVEDSKLEAYPEHDAILKKLDFESEAIRLGYYPNQKNYNQADMMLAEDYYDKDTLKAYMSYEVQLRDDFEEYYEALAKRVTATKLAQANLKLEARSYDAANGILTIAGKEAKIIRQPKMKGKENEKNPAKLMRLLFAVNTFPSAVPIREIFPVKADVYPPEIIKRANRLVAQINDAIKEVAPVKDVIKHDKFKFYIDNSYLK